MPKRQLPQAQKDDPGAVDSGQLDRIRSAAYFRAQKRGFEPGLEMEDWLIAESGLLSPALLPSLAGHGIGAPR